MLCKILIINMLDYKFKRFIFNTVLMLWKLEQIMGQLRTLTDVLY